MGEIKEEKKGAVVKYTFNHPFPLFLTQNNRVALCSFFRGTMLPHRHYFPHNLLVMCVDDPVWCMCV